MIFTKAGLVNEAEIEAGVRKVEREFAPDVVQIRYFFDENHWGDPMVDFRIVIRDEAKLQSRAPGDLYDTVSKAVRREARTDENGLFAHFWFRTVSNQHKTRDPRWN
jgi:hypothetical protein